MEALSPTTLHQFGLSDKEASLYFASLSLGTASIAELAKKANLKRPTAYLVVDALLQKGFLVAIPHGKKVRYKPENPEKIQEKIEKMRRALDTSLPEMKALFDAQHVQPKIVFYDTKEGIHKLYEEIFRSKEIWSVFSPDSFHAVFTKEELAHYIRLLDRAGGVIHDVFENTKGAYAFATEPKYVAVSEARVLPKGKKVRSDVLIAGNKVAFVSFNTLIGVLIEDESIALTLRLVVRSLFENSAPMREEFTPSRSQVADSL
jgi:sugar-specific transcriptional regulator TrmB